MGVHEGLAWSNGRAGRLLIRTQNEISVFPPELSELHWQSCIRQGSIGRAVRWSGTGRTGVFSSSAGVFVALVAAGMEHLEQA
eukprot:361182-Chlamydomonas_euryale.AAC.9